jgi:hypothetical protein
MADAPQKQLQCLATRATTSTRASTNSGLVRIILGVMKIRTVTGATIRLSKHSALWLDYVIPCGRDWVAEVKLIDVGRPRNPSHARVFTSENLGVATLMSLAHQRGQLKIRTLQANANAA